MEGSASRRRGLICGVLGQDGAYLAQLLIDKGYEVWGTTRNAGGANLAGLEALGIAGQVRLVQMQPVDFADVHSTVADVMPHEIYNLASQSSVGMSFDTPRETIESISMGTLNLLEAVRTVDAGIRFFNAASGECFGDTGERAADEATPFRPGSPYAAAKAAACWQVSVYRQAYRLFACNGILFNHESPLCPERFVTRKIVSAARRIADGSGEKLSLGNVAVRRDWGWAPEYVEAMWRMLNHEVADDFVIATGSSLSLQEFVEAAFDEARLDWRDHVITDNALLRPYDPLASRGDPQKIARVLSWKPRCSGAEVARRLFRAECGRPEIVSSGGIDV